MSRFDFTPQGARRRPSLTPMIDVVFLLLVFFMLAARFGQDTEIALSAAGSASAAWQGPPRLIEIEADALRLNGRALSPDALIRELSALLPEDTAPVILVPGPDASVQRLLDVMSLLDAETQATLVVGVVE